MKAKPASMHQGDWGHRQALRCAVWSNPRAQNPIGICTKCRVVRILVAEPSDDVQQGKGNEEELCELTASLPPILAYSSSLHCRCEASPTSHSCFAVSLPSSRVYWERNRTPSNKTDYPHHPSTPSSSKIYPSFSPSAL